MSRVRILNLPNDTTEKELKEHFTKKLPPNAPALEITDVMIKRLKPEEGGSGTTGTRNEKGSTSPSSSIAGNRGLSARLGKIRMAFVGFKSSAAGHFVVSYYNNSYFRSSKIRVELAKGLNEVGVTLNMKKKQEKLQQQQQEEKEAEKGERTAAGATCGAGLKRTRHGALASPDETTSHQSRDEITNPLDSSNHQDPSTEGASPFDARKKTRKELFIEERTQATAGPSWAAEVLVPQAAPSAEAADSLGHHGSDGHDADGLTVTGHEGEGEDDGLDEEERERLALEKQQALGAVSDLDFLSALGGGGGGGGGGSSSSAPQPHQEEESEASGQEAHAQDTEGTASSVPATADIAQEAGDPSPHAPHAAKAAADEEVARASHRVRIGNIPYTATEDHVKQFAASLVGPVEAVHIPLTKDTRQSKGAAFVKFVAAEDAVRALTLCRGAILMGRLLRVSAAEEDPHSKRALEREAKLATATGGGEAGVGMAGSSEFKLRKEKERRGEASGVTAATAAGAGHVSWNTMYMNASAAVDNVAQRLGVKAEDLVGVQAKGAAVRAAIAEAYLTSEIQQVLSDEGVAFDVLESGQQSLLKARSNTTILVKNLQLAGAEEAKELSKMFVRYGTLETSVFPSSGTFALFRFVHPQDARTAFTRLSYKLFKNAPLFLEWAPVGAIVEEEGTEPGAKPDALAALDKANGANGTSADKDGHDDDDDDDDGKRKLSASAVVYTAFITNIPFTASEDDFHAFLLDSCPRLAKAPDTFIKRLAFQKEQGRAYLTLADAATYHYCLGRLNGKSFEGRTLSCVASKQTTLDAASAAAGGHAHAKVAPTSGIEASAANDDDELPLRKTAAATGATAADRSSNSASANNKVPPGADPHKVIVKNVPFEATEADIRELFSAFSEVKSVRLPRKTNNFTTHRENNHRGFAFVEFLSASEAARAMETLKATHLYGRHLVLQYAKLDG